MSGQKKLERAVRNIRVAAIPSKKVKREVLDNNGKPMVDRKGTVVEDTVQLYRIKPIH